MTIFSATQCCNIVATLFRMVTTLQRCVHCKKTAHITQPRGDKKFFFMSERRGRVNIFKTREENFVSPSDHVILYSGSSDNGHSRTWKALLTAAFIKPSFSHSTPIQLYFYISISGQWCPRAWTVFIILTPLKHQTISLYYFSAARGAIQRITIATVIFSRLRITCYFQGSRCFAQKVTWYFIGVI